MKKNIKTIIGLIIVFIIGISTTVGATAIFKSEDITYSSDKTDKTNVKDSLDELYGKVGKCPEGQYCFGKAMPISILELGDYISMTPTSKSYTPPSELTGCMNDDTCMQNEIDPSELNLWRVIRKNDDGTVDVVSEYVSSKKVYFYGKTGYQNFVGGLNTIASQYTNEKYVQSTRHMGYSNQKEICTGTLTYDSYSSCLLDEGYKNDLDLVKIALGDLLVTDTDGEVMTYYLASRMSARSEMTAFYSFRNIQRRSDGDGFVAYQCIYRANTDGTYLESGLSTSVRPVLTLKAEVQIKSGDGKSGDTAYQLS